MRHIVRPFKIEFKSRSSRSTPMGSPTEGHACKDSGTPPLLNVGVFAAERRARANTFEAAMKAANAVFGRTSSPAPAPEAIPASSAPVGLVLIENGGALGVRLAGNRSKGGS